MSWYHHKNTVQNTNVQLIIMIAKFQYHSVFLRAYPENRWRSPIQVDTGLYLNRHDTCTRLKMTRSRIFHEKMKTHSVSRHTYPLEAEFSLLISLYGSVEFILEIVVHLILDTIRLPTHKAASRQEYPLHFSSVLF